MVKLGCAGFCLHVSISVLSTSITHTHTHTVFLTHVLYIHTPPLIKAFMFDVIMEIEKS